MGPQVANAYTYQLNTNFFSGSPACADAANPAVCQGWEQFLFENDGTQGWAFIQYWILSYNNPCPGGGWISFPYPGPTDISCYRDSTNSAAVPNQPITNLATTSLSGTGTAGSDG